MEGTLLCSDSLIINWFFDDCYILIINDIY